MRSNQSIDCRFPEQPPAETRIQNYLQRSRLNLVTTRLHQDLFRVPCQAFGWSFPRTFLSTNLIQSDPINEDDMPFLGARRISVRASIQSMRKRLGHAKGLEPKRSQYADVMNDYNTSATALHLAARLGALRAAPLSTLRLLV